jgi:hypothetical protein
MGIYAGDDNADGGIRIMAPEQLHIPLMPPLQSTTQQSAEGAFHNAPQVITQQSTEGGVANAPLYQLHYGQTLFTPDRVTRPQQQLYLNRDPTAPGMGVFAPLQQRPVPTQQQPAGQQPGANPPQSSTQQSAKKKIKKGSESSSNEKTKNSLSERRESIVKSIDKLASFIVAPEEANSAAAASLSSMMLMFLMMQMQQQAQQLQFQEALIKRDVEMQLIKIVI